MAELLPYTLIEGTNVLRPLLRLNLSYHGQTVEVSGLLDSGADVNVLPYTVGAMLGIPWQTQPLVMSPSGNLSQYETRGVALNAIVGTHPSVRLGFAWTKAPNVPLILGQENFFAIFDVCFFRSRSTFQVQLKEE